MPDTPTRPVRFLTNFRDAAGVASRVETHLSEGLRDSRHPFHWPSLATVGVDGTPASRVVVLRGFDPALHTLSVHTDSRSAKVTELAANPRATLLFYDHGAQFQARAAVTVAIHHMDAVAEAGWANQRDSSRANYAEPHPPGVEMAPDAPVEPAPPVAVGDRDKFAQFIVLVCRIESMDLVELHPAGHRRARLSWDATGPRLVRVGA